MFINVSYHLLQVSSTTTQSCRCHGISGTCSIKTCFNKGPEMDEIGKKVRNDYTVSLAVELQNDKLVRKDGISTNIPNHLPVYVQSSPSFCKKDLALGTTGTARRPCSNNPNAPDSCGVLCCQRGAYFIVEEFHDECCEFVWCCYARCSPCNFRNVTSYFCNS